MYCKRNEELITKVNNIIENGNLSEEEKGTLQDVLKAYKSSTFDTWGDRHEFYGNIVVDMVNDMNFRDEELAEKMANTHPTLQQNFMRFVLKFISKMSKKMFVDDRNRASVEKAKQIMSAMEEPSYVPHI